MSLVLGFARVHGTSYSSRNYTQRSCKVGNNEDAIHSIGAFCSNFFMKPDGQWDEYDYPFYLTLDNYKGTLTKSPSFNNNVIQISIDLLKKINSLEGKKSFILKLKLKINNFVTEPILDDIRKEVHMLPSTKVKRQLSKKSTHKPTLNVQINDFVVVLVPAYKGTPKNYVAQALDVKDDEILVSFLKKSFDKYFFPEKPDFSWVNSVEIVNILKIPVINKREQLMFPELKDCEIKICS